MVNLVSSFLVPDQTQLIDRIPTPQAKAGTTLARMTSKARICTLLRYKEICFMGPLSVAKQKDTLSTVSYNISFVSFITIQQKRTTAEVQESLPRP